jgi:hypothetical protein
MRTKDEAVQYLTTLGHNAGLDEVSIAKILANESVVKDAQDHLARHDEMSSYMDKSRNEVSALQRQIADVNDWYNRIAAPAVAHAEKLKTGYEKYRTTFGELDDVAGPQNGNNGGNVNNVRWASKDEMNQIGLSAIQVAKQINRCGMDYFKRFGEVLDPDELEKYAVSRGLAPDAAYREMIAPRVAEAEKKSAEEKETQHQGAIKAAREEGVREGMTRRQWGSESSKTTDSFGRDLEAIKKTPEDAQSNADQEFMKAWQQFDQEHASDLR